MLESAVLACMSPDNQRPSALRRVGLLAAKAAVSVLLLVLLFSRVDVAALWNSARGASVPWLMAALAVFFGNILASTWRWQLLLRAQGLAVPSSTLLSSYLVATFFNNFLPSNIGGDVIRIGDSARYAGSKTLATTVVLMDRGIGLIGLVLVAATGATMAARLRAADASPIWPSWLWAGFVVGVVVAAPAVLAPGALGRLLRPLTVLHPEWVGGRIDTLTTTLARFRERPMALVGCFVGAIAVQALLVLFYVTVAHALAMPVGAWDLAVIVPISFLVQMVPISMNGFGVREAAFSFYFTRVGLPFESAVLLPLVATAVVMAFSLSGAVTYVARGGRKSIPPDVPEPA